METATKEPGRVDVDAVPRPGGGWEAWAVDWPDVRAEATTLADAEAEVQREAARLRLVQRPQRVA
jgi:hypothetical protein